MAKMNFVQMDKFSMQSSPIKMNIAIKTFPSGRVFVFKAEIIL
jgi:hypothetical protein